MFDYGVPDEYMNSANIKVWPTEGNKVALVDADPIPYIVGFSSSLQEYLKAKRNGILTSRAFEQRIDYANSILNSWIRNAGCDSAMLFLTGATNFRKDIGKEKPYKGQRPPEKPPFFHEIKNWLHEFHGASVSDYCEADDDISKEAWRRHLELEVEPWTEEHKSKANFVVISIDKDLAIIPGWHCQPDKPMQWVDPLGSLEPVWKTKDIVNYEYWPLFNGKTIPISSCESVVFYRNEIITKTAEELSCPKQGWEFDYVWYKKKKRQDCYTRGPRKGKGKFKRVKCGTKKSESISKLRGTGLKFFYSQILTGDTTDNYPGLKGCGCTTAYELLDETTSEQEMYDIVEEMYVREYSSKGPDMLLEQARLAHMQTEQGELWKRPTRKRGTFPL